MLLSHHLSTDDNLDHLGNGEGLGKEELLRYWIFRQNSMK